ncbi:hypothetical protein [Endozoicomonas atrinae]|uniref:hypothetical protein n=1 Tax=Endozoicomonas atrinae TaxID=1333660 RepID=UPI003AFF8602
MADSLFSVFYGALGEINKQVDILLRWKQRYITWIGFFEITLSVKRIREGMRASFSI